MSSSIFWVKSIWNRFLVTFATASYILLSAGLVQADDTEIYVANALINPSQPNILFVMDTSGSMNLPPSSGGARKIDQMKSALTSLLDSLQGVNVGLMRFTAYQTQNVFEAGGPVLYPVKDIDAGVDPLVIAQVNQSSDDGIETPFGGVRLGDSRITMVNDYVDCAGCRVTTVEPLSGADNILYGTSTNQAVAVLGDNDNALSLRYQVNVPKDARIFSAKIVFTGAPNDSSAKYSEPLNLDLWWQRANYPSYPNDADEFNNGTSIDSGRSFHGHRNWYNVPVFNNGATINEDAQGHVTWALDWSTDKSQWQSGDHLVFKFQRKKDYHDTSCTANCGPTPQIWVPDYQPPGIPQPDNCAAPVCTNLVTNCAPAPIIVLTPGYQPADIPQPDLCDPPVCNNCPAPVILLVPGYQPPPIPQPDTCISDGEGGQICTPNPDIIPAFVPDQYGPDPAFVPSYNPPVCTPQPPVTPPYVPDVTGPDPTWPAPTYAAPVCTPVPDIIPPIVPGHWEDDPNAPAPVYNDIWTYPPNAALRNAYGVGTANPPRLEIVWLPNKSDQTIAIRFDEVHVPQGATITSAFLDFSTEGYSSSSSLDVYAEKSVNSPTLTTTNFDISSRPLTSNHTNWDNIVTWGSGVTDRKTSPNLKDVVEEVVGQAGWCAGKPMTFIIKGDSTGKRRFRTWDNNRTEYGYMPKLRIRYDENSAVGGCNSTKVVSKIANNNDDAEENTTSTGYNTNSSTLDSTNYIGLRFQNIAIPQGATITSAYIRMTSRGNRSGGQIRTIRGLAVDDAPPWVAQAGFLVSAPKTTASSSWTHPYWSYLKALRSSDISNVIQEIVGRGGWTSGNSLALILDPTGSNYKAYAGNDSLRKPELVVSYSAPFQLGTRTVRDELKYLVAGLNAQGATPISGALGEASRYYRGGDVYYGQNRGFATNDIQRRYYRTSHPDSFTGGTDVLPHGCYDRESSVYQCHGEEITGNPTYVSPITDICQTNNIVLLSDGTPNTSFPSAKAIIDPVIAGDGNVNDGFVGYPGGCATALDGKDCSLKVAEAMANEDQETAFFNGIQTIKTHTIGFDLSAGGDAAVFLEALATAGKGSAYSADNANGLANVFDTIIKSLQRESRSFVSAGVSVNQANRLIHRDELYFALFQPDTDTTWPGNLKRYKLLNGQVVDSNDVNAVTSVGRFKDTAQSFWSSIVDGDGVDLGGAASRLTTTRSVYTNITADPITSANNRVIESNVNITDADLNATDAIDRTDILRWARGIDDANGGIARKEMGDPLHSRPVVANYPSNSSVVFIGTNHGYLHAISSATGDENWSFIPEELLSNLTIFQKNSVVTSHVYGLDGNISLYHDDTDHDSVIDPGETAILYVGMRRGGRNYYAFDVSNPTTPSLLFEIKGGVGDYAELGQTWSKMTIAKIRFNGADRLVAIFGGGYDTNQDIIGAHSPDGVGRTVFIADALTGARLWSARIDATDPTVGTSAVNNLTNSIPADVKAVDLSGSGYVEHLYVSDTAGQIFRFDINNVANTGAADLAVGGRLANIQSGAATEFNNRRFYYAPDVAAVKRPNYEDFIAVSVGTGYRAHPVANGTNDKFYVIRDTWVLDNKSFPAITGTPRDLTEGDLQDITNTIGDTNSDGISDALVLIENTGAPKYGWYLDFLQTGEKVLAESVTFNNKVIVTTYKPNLAGAGTGICEAPEGSSRAYVMNILDGTPTIDTNTDGDLEDLTTGPADTTTCGDRCKEIGRGIPPSGLVLFEPEGATICFGTQCFANVLSSNGERLQRVKWRRRDGP